MKSSEESRLNTGERKLYRIPPPSAELKERVLSAGRAAWAASEPEPADVPWGFPLLRFAACLTIAAGLIYFANTASERFAPPRIAFESSTGLTGERGVLANDIMASRLAAAAIRVPPENAFHDLLAWHGRIHEMLKTAPEQNG